MGLEESFDLLIVDDSATFRAIVLAMLGDSQRIRIATTAREALEAVQTAPPDIILLDIVLPDGEGYDICAEIRACRFDKPIQIILMSATQDHDRLARIIASGADDFINKPFEELEFQLRMKAAAIRLRRQRELVKERDFYRQAVQQEESLTVKLLDRQMNLRENLADFEQQQEGLENENRRLHSIARYDSLTGLLNRHSIEARLELEARRSLRDGSSLWGLFIDLDHFRQLNESYGHVTGDDVLRTVCTSIKRCLRREDFAGRYGGEEFFVVLPDSSMETARSVAERIRHSISSLPFHSRGTRIPVSASIGIAEFKKDGTAQAWVERADAAMRLAKEHGRNRVDG
jgi:diguanylate cyclase (GGDEF)-like protein